MITLLFIYNAKSGKLNALFDSGHKLLSPSTYQCNLCALTYNIFRENKVWKEFRKSSDVDLKFLHIDEFEDQFPNEKQDYPVILKEQETEIQPFLNSEELNEVETVDRLIQLIKNKYQLTK